MDENSLSPVHTVAARSPFCAGLSRAEVEQIVEAGRVQTVLSGQTVCEQGQEGNSMFLILEGRVQVTVDYGGGTRTFLKYLEQGDHFGEMALLAGEPRAATVTAVIDTQLLVLNRPAFDRILGNVPTVALNLSRKLGAWLRGTHEPSRQHHGPAILGLVGATPRARNLVGPLAEALLRDGLSVQILTDRTGPQALQGKFGVQFFSPEAPGQDKVLLFRAWLSHALERRERAFVDLNQEAPELPYWLRQCEEVWWLAEGEDFHPSYRRLQALLEQAPALAGRIHWVWVFSAGGLLPPPAPADLGLAEPEFRVRYRGLDGESPRFRPQDLARLRHRVQGIRLGLALGGGGARGLAHLGVLRALEREGIFFDLLAGTSMGAMMAVLYARGYSPKEILEFCQHEFYLANRLRHLPWGKTLKLWLLFRWGGWTRVLRRYLANDRLEQFPIPVFTITVDLIKGNLLVRDQGDAVEAVRESINLPGISRPILRDGAAFVDGAVLNNVPGDVLRDRGADFVVAVDVGARLAQKFGPNLPTTPAAQMRNPGIYETMLRIIEVQQHGLLSAHSSAVNLVITPETSVFSFIEMYKTAELADAGEEAAQKALPRLKEMLAALIRP